MVSVNQLNAMRGYFESGATKSYEFRKQQLIKLSNVLQQNENEIFNALFTDLKKSPEECWATEIGILLAEIKNTLSHLKNWIKPQKVKTNFLNLPSSSFILNEPLGNVLIIGPWNYPFLLLLKPLIGAMAAGNCVVLKASEHAPASSALIRKMIEENFDSQYILFTEGDGHLVVTDMMKNFVFDHVFFTGSTVVGKAVYQMAAENLIPVTLELGGKTPCLIEKDANLKVAARRIAVTKFSNAGQMCVSPDYLLVHHSIKQEMVAALKETIRQFYTEDPSKLKYSGKIINEKQFDRIVQYLKNGQVIFGGKYNKADLFIEPTLMDDIDVNSPLMTEEIFGPILPIIGYETREEAAEIISRNKNPLAFYIFTTSKQNENFWLQKIPSGGGCINNAAWHLTNQHLPLGGRGLSGIGRYHGKYSFETFSHQKSFLKTPNWFDPALKYPPFNGKLPLLKWLMK